MSDLTEFQDSKLRKRVVTLIKRYPQPKEIFWCITNKEYPYSIQHIPKLPIRDRAIMAAYYVSAGRGAEVVGGHAYTRSLPSNFIDGKLCCVVCNTKLEGTKQKFCSKECRMEIHTHRNATVLPKSHHGLLIENLELTRIKSL
jgi:hypothetical protein